MLYEAAPEAPEWIRRVPAALEKWAVIWLVLESTRVNVYAHSDFVGQYCIAYADMREALGFLSRSKLVKETRTVGVGDKAKTTVEKVTVSPYQTIYMNATREMERLGRMIGLEPVNPLEETRSFQDYAEILRAEDDGGYNVDDGNDGNGGDTAQTEICTDTSRAGTVLDS